MRSSSDGRPPPSRRFLSPLEEYDADLCRARERGEIRDPDGCPDPGSKSPGISVEDDKHYRSGDSSDIYNQYVRTSHVTFDVHPTSIEWRRGWFEEHADGRHRIFVAILDGRVAGYASSSKYRAKAAYETSVETSVYVAPHFVGRGVGASLYAVLLDGLEREDVHRALAGIAQPNEASVALHRRFGFRLVAHFSEQGRKFDRYWDVDWYERELG
jgi:phosphinothricin acetyltransferase